MPLLKSSKKKMRRDNKKTVHNDKIRVTLKGLIKNSRRTPSAESFSQTSSALDKAVKTNLIHKNKAARLKSRLAKLMATA